MRTLLFSTLYPSGNRPGHGVFVETRLRELLGSGRVQTKVVAPVPWFPSRHPRFGSYAQMASTPHHETRHGIDVFHPRYPLPPKVGMNIAPLLLAISSLPTLRRLRREGFDFDLIDAHYYYPDGVAAALLAAWLHKPLAITARGTDLNLISRHVLPRRWMQWAARRAACSIGVSNALVDILRGWDVPPERLKVMRNGVDLERFQPVAPDQARQALGLSGGPILLAVGNLVELKGHHLIIEALALLRAEHPDARLVLVGDGIERSRLVELAGRLGVADRVRFAGQRPHTELGQWYSAADVSILASSREGWPNVLLESMACGTPVVAARIGGTPEIVQAKVAGTLVDARSPAAFARAIAELLASRPERSAVREYAQGFGWGATTQAQLTAFEHMLAHERA